MWCARCGPTKGLRWVNVRPVWGWMYGGQANKTTSTNSTGLHPLFTTAFHQKLYYSFSLDDEVLFDLSYITNISTAFPGCF